jgi:uncharacterized protein
VTTAELRKAIDDAKVPRMALYVMGPGTPGSTGNYWTETDTWPASKTASFFLGPNRTLTATAASAADSSTYTYDPSDPAKSYGGNNLILHPCGPQDQHALEARSDVLSFTSDVFTNDTAIVGRMQAELFVSSNRNDTDFHVTLTDVWENGKSMLIQYGAIRMRWRAGPTKMVPMTPGQVYKVTVDLWSSAMVINEGHRVRLDITSSNSPHFSVNPNTGLPLVDQGSAKLVAENTIHSGGNFPSRLLLPLVPLSELPPTHLGGMKTGMERLARSGGNVPGHNLDFDILLEAKIFSTVDGKK